MHENPYESPFYADRVSSSRQRSVIGPCRFWLGLLFALMGVVSVFVRNMPPLGWFLLAAVFFLGGFLAPRSSYRAASALGCILCLLASVGTVLAYRARQLEHERYLRYQQELQETRQQH